MSSKPTSSNKFLLLLIPVIALGVIWGVKTIAGSAKTSEPTAGSASSQPASEKLSPEMMTELQKPLTEAVEALEGGDLARPKREYAEWKETWEKAEASFKQQSPEAYAKVGQAMQQVEQSAINPSSPEKEAAIAAFKALSAAIGSGQ